MAHQSNIVIVLNIVSQKHKNKNKNKAKQNKTKQNKQNKQTKHQAANALEIRTSDADEIWTTNWLTDTNLVFITIIFAIILSVANTLHVCTSLICTQELKGTQCTKIRIFVSSVNTIVEPITNPGCGNTISIFTQEFSMRTFWAWNVTKEILMSISLINS